MTLTTYWCTATGHLGPETVTYTTFVTAETPRQALEFWAKDRKRRKEPHWLDVCVLPIPSRSVPGKIKLKEKDVSYFEWIDDDRCWYFSRPEPGKTHD